MSTADNSKELTTPQARMLFRLAGHRYGWAYCTEWRERRSFEALLNRGLVQTHDYGQTYNLTPEGYEAVERRWPKSPAILKTYEVPDGGWDLLAA